MASIDNLNMFDKDQNRDKAREAGRKGGVASGIARRRKKNLLELINIVGNANIPEEKREQMKSVFKDIISDEDYTYNAMVVLALYEKAITEKDTRAIEDIFEYSDRTQTVDDQYSELSVSELRGLLDESESTKSTNNPKT